MILLYENMSRKHVASFHAYNPAVKRGCLSKDMFWYDAWRHRADESSFRRRDIYCGESEHFELEVVGKFGTRRDSVRPSALG